MAELWLGGPLVLPHTFTLDGHELTLSEVPTPTLLGWLASGNWSRLFPGLVSAEQMLPFTLRFRDDDDVFDYDHLYYVATVLFGRLTGMASLDGLTDGWWPGQRLAATALHNWPIYSAWCAAHGHGPFDGALHQSISSIYAWLRERATPEGWDRLDQTIFAPPPHLATLSEAAVPRAIRDAEASAALAALREAGGEVVAEWK